MVTLLQQICLNGKFRGLGSKQFWVFRSSIESPKLNIFRIRTRPTNRNAHSIASISKNVAKTRRDFCTRLLLNIILSLILLVMYLIWRWILRLSSSLTDRFLPGFMMLFMIWTLFLGFKFQLHYSVHCLPCLHPLTCLLTDECFPF